jgi:hypothetical protein
VGHLDWGVTDEDSTFNVAENLRALPPASSRYAAPHGWRQTIENDNHRSDARKIQGRGRSAPTGTNSTSSAGRSRRTASPPNSTERASPPGKAQPY